MAQLVDIQAFDGQICGEHRHFWIFKIFSIANPYFLDFFPPRIRIADARDAVAKPAMDFYIGEDVRQI